jgi:flagellar basal-body rod protein FlgF
MLKGIFNTMAGKQVTGRRMEMLSHNIANSLTPGYKASRVTVNTVKQENPAEAGADVQSTYLTTLGTYINFSEAALVESGSPLDFAIQGDGYFVVSTPRGNMYTRNGQFTLDKDKRLVNMEGYPVMGQGGEITIDGKVVIVENDGSIHVDDGSAGVTKIVAGILKVVDFKDKQDLESAGNSLFMNKNVKGGEITPDKFAVKQGFYEASNVNVMNEMIEMISALRAYESYTKVDQFFGDMMDRLLELPRL